MVTTTQDIMRGTVNTETQKVLNYVQGYRTEKEIVKEFFGLREELVYDDDGINIKEYVSDFWNHKALKEKKVQYNQILAEKGITEEVFNQMFTNWLPSLETKQESNEPTTDTGGTWDTTENTNRKPWKTKKK